MVRSFLFKSQCSEIDFYVWVDKENVFHQSPR